MSSSNEDQSHAIRLRSEFDRSFAEPSREQDAVLDDFLRLRVHGDPFAFRLSELASLQAGLAVVAARSAVPEFLGIAGLRGALVPVYDLHALLGRAAAHNPRWLAITAGRDSVGLAFETFEGHLRLPRGTGVVELAGRGSLTPQGLETPSELFLVVSVASICEVIQQRVRQGEPSKE